MRTSLVVAVLCATQTLAVDLSSTFDLSKLKVEAVDAEPLTQYTYTHGGQPISPWHDVPYVASTEPDGSRLLHFVCEIPVGTTAKYEIHKSVPFNPVIQDVKKGKPRFYAYGPSLVNYGAIAQTWEDPAFITKETGFGGDNDPVDVLQINAKPCFVGEIMPVRVLGVLALVDDDETDWKLIVVDPRDPAVAAYRDIKDVPEAKVSAMREWFRLYKTAEGKGPNKFGLDEQAMDAAFAMRVADETHELWRTMKDKECDFDGTPCWTSAAKGNSEL
mmetsp:Transcript_89253/g.178383  ORF Transcript_89253/g.178383 Transcript_89253/m.178383 type:complete len:274 (-) Transcript_89253:310-1131(-)|eukprot:CAMPEP_0171629096 /NCGR_PEP_ID=MMETSP0990-20121206/21931_1 /TAXON_ID=483369 /ORGANISM="non described non described, Strain CCMP2098" /LENGTH=273 /DNA_ID=CAMNT_0012197611 /DNA_START=67 /DNA_END=888 /DNA_ORIENTATION=+